MKRVRSFIIALVIIVLGGGVAWTVYSHKQADVTDQVKTSNYTVKSIGELDALSVMYDKTVKETEASKILGLKVGTEESLYVFHFKAQVYYDLNQAQSHYDKEKKALAVTMPKAQVKLLLKDDKYTESYDYYKIKNNMFIDDTNDKGLAVQKKAVKDVKSDILERADVLPTAQKSAKATLEQMFKNDPIKVVISFT